ncbi:bacillithiol biosynthesis deacetylase BshB1 [Membranicola marinus]|uniref:Bacillithiol biosynthesis deacetylase BshB1 n=1 Tax=Membranihabitans marinus TaxID=1227546 RepID=A0A953HRU8_9BACT|nr:bacillithiol biosynthesis deacetylase BshB1 [Membranihabitans marinus]MBY5957215.1 bacillithiol biosynthesis deacetylase BshB1 [Membranihabitans marinus]
MEQIKKVNILAVGVHPDDVELSITGTLAVQKQKGHSFGILDLTQGELGTRGTPEIRLREAENAARIQNAQFRVNLGFRDGFFTGTESEKLEIVKVIRAARPDILIANATHDRHPDHGRSAKLVYDAWFLSGLKSIETHIDGDVQERWRPKVIYHYLQDYIIPPDVVVDVSDTFDIKMKAIKAFRSQFYDPESKELDSPLTNKDFFDQVEGRARSLGRQIGVEYGEGLTAPRYIGVRDLFDLI